MRNEIEQKLSAIQGLQIWAAGHAANMLWLQVGNRHIVPTRGGGTKEVGTYALTLIVLGLGHLTGRCLLLKNPKLNS